MSDFLKKRTFGYIIDTRSIVKFVTRKGSAKKLNQYLCQHCRCGFFFFLHLSDVHILIEKFMHAI